jgi:hypothetical protein
VSTGNLVTGVRIAAALAGLWAACAAGQVAAETPTLVNAYAQQLVAQCGGAMTPSLEDSVIQRIDLNGDKLDDWVIDASRYPCPTRPAVFADTGQVVTVFMGVADGRALPAFQRAAFGARLEGKPETGYSLWLTLGGADCGETGPKARCDRRLAWGAKTRRFELVPLDAKPAPLSATVAAGPKAAKKRAGQ